MIKLKKLITEDKKQTIDESIVSPSTLIWGTVILTLLTGGALKLLLKKFLGKNVFTQAWKFFRPGALKKAMQDPDVLKKAGVSDDVAEKAVQEIERNPSLITKMQAEVQKQILKQVKNGKMTVNDAYDQLHGFYTSAAEKEQLRQSLKKLSPLKPTMKTVAQTGKQNKFVQKLKTKTAYSIPATMKTSDILTTISSNYKLVNKLYPNKYNFVKGSYNDIQVPGSEFIEKYRAGGNIKRKWMRNPKFRDYVGIEDVVNQMKRNNIQIPDSVTNPDQLVDFLNNKGISFITRNDTYFADPDYLGHAGLPGSEYLERVVKINEPEEIQRRSKLLWGWLEQNKSKLDPTGPRDRVRPKLSSSWDELGKIKSGKGVPIGKTVSWDIPPKNPKP